MVTKKATIKREESSTHLLLHTDVTELKITLTDDNPNMVKIVFNELLKNLKKELFKFKLEDKFEDLYHDICIEYITQLNSELTIVYRELEEFNLLEDQSGEPK